MGKTVHQHSDERQNKTGKSMDEPKGGAGGKGTWGKPGVDDLKDMGDDPKDIVRVRLIFSL